jgi:hypothetical protein
VDLRVNRIWRFLCGRLSRRVVWDTPAHPTQEDEMGLLDKLLGRDKRSHDHDHDHEHEHHEHTPEYNELNTQEPPPPAAGTGEGTTAAAPAPPTSGTETTES